MLSATNMHGYPTIIWAGRNNYADPTTVKADIAAMVASLGHQNYLVLGILNGDYANEYSGQSSYVTLTTLNSDLSSIYGSHYIDIRAYLVAHYDSGITQDVIDYGRDIVPSSLRSDSLHLNTAGYALVAERVNEDVGILLNGSDGVLTLSSLRYAFANPYPIGTATRSAGYFSQMSVGTSSNSQALDVVGNLKLNNGTNSTTFGQTSGGDIYIANTAGSIFLKNFGYTDSTIIGSSGNLQVNSVQSSSFTGTGNLGVGTTSAVSKLHVVSPNEQMRLGYNMSNYGSFTVGSTGNLTISATGTNAAIALNPTGSGIVSSISGTNSAFNYQINNTSVGTGASAGISVRNSNNVAGQTTLSQSSTGFTPYGIWGANEGVVYNNSGAINLLADGASGIIKFAAGGNGEDMRITAAGNVGIGTTTPGAKLSVVGGVRIDGATEMATTTLGTTVFLPTSDVNRFSSGLTVVFEGDSLSAADTVGCKTSLSDMTCADWPTQLMGMSTLRNRVSVKNNFALPGGQASHMQSRYTASVHPLSPAVTGNPGILFVWIGANDYRVNGTTTIESDISNYWATAKADGWKVVAFTIQKRGDDINDGGNGANEANRQTVNSWIRAQFKEGAYDYLVDADRLMSNPWDVAMFSTDTIHQNNNGRYAIAKHVNSVLWGDGIVLPVSDISVTVGSGAGNYRASVENLSRLTTGGSNTAAGKNALMSLTVGGFNTAFGYQASYSEISGSRNTVVGYLASKNSTTTSDNTSMGFGALTSNTGGSANVAVGSNSLLGLSTGGRNVALGYYTSGSLTTGQDNVAIGYQAMRNITGAGGTNIAIGANALLNGLSSGTVVIGANAGTNIAGNNNVCIGNGACTTLTSGINNVVVGLGQVGAAVQGAVQLGIGTNSTSNTLQFQSALLADSLGNLYGNSFTASTTSADGGITIKNNTAAGKQYSIYSSGTGSTMGAGNFNIFDTTAGSSRLSITSTGNVGIGTTSPTAQLTNTGTVRLGALGSAGASLITDAYGNVTVSSDERLKDVQGQFTRGLSDLSKISPITYKWNGVSGFDTAGLYTGFSAQNVQSAIPEAVGTDSRGYLTLSDRPILAAVVNAVKELSAKVDALVSSNFTYVNKITTKELCLEDVCINRQQLLDLINRAGSSYTTSPVSVPVVEAATSSVDTTASSSVSATTSPEVAPDATEPASEGTVGETSSTSSEALPATE
jgi:hypothetical protein